MAESRYTMEQFLADARAAVDQGLEAKQTAAKIEPLLRRLVATPDWLRDLGHEALPDKSFDVLLTEDLSVQCIVWKDGARAGPHNHNGWGVIGVVAGCERNTPYAREDDGSTPWRAEIEAQSPVDLRPGEAVSFAPPHDIHSVEIPFGPTVAVHAYGNNIRRQWRYRFDAESGEVTPFDPSQVELA